ncbi:sugar transferase [Aliifodinibius sp. S!AR15-10]|uniref:sugar transferase n=1 Tax=Aliifodinibius sp. S!AR15-10 TaxID=2950437 RepID=UPI00286334C5|nr:sugar transferase [Aliifodinibius sp. S!AR15-10]MDR8393485.1 sugar transferase [Aliifodinibius sp. S!AR15-10]
MRGNSRALSLDNGEETTTVRESIMVHTELDNNAQSITENVTPPQFHVLSKKQYRSKRILDVILSGIGVLIMALVYPFIALAIKLSSPGPVIFKQQRTGLNGNPFTCFKFRTMHVLQRRERNGKPDITQKGDARIFWFGSLLRKLNLDELPQLFNVLKGDMSLVGPRPYPVQECAYWNSTFEDFFYRYSVKPGISGFAQAKGYRGGTLDEEHMRKRLDYDLIYVQKNSLSMDLKIIGRTILQMIHLDTNGH